MLCTNDIVMFLQQVVFRGFVYGVVVIWPLILLDLCFTVVKMVRLLEMVDSSVIQGFHMQVDDVHRCYREAYDNVRFLATLERHFRVRSPTLYPRLMLANICSPFAV